MTSAGRDVGVNSARTFWRWSAAALFGLLLAFTWISESVWFDRPVDHVRRPIVPAVGVLVLAGLVYFVQALVSARRPPGLGTVLLWGIAFRAVLLFSTPVEEDDFYRYLWDGRVVAAGLDPYVYSPTQVRHAAAEPVPRPAADPLLAALVEMLEHDPRALEVFERINNPDIATIYPPLVVRLFSLHALLVPGGWNLRSQLVVLKLLVGGFDLMTLLFLALLLHRAGRPAGLCVLYGWCPLVLKECWNSAHCDVVAVCFAVAGMCVLVPRQPREERRLSVGAAATAGILLGLSAAARVYGLVLLPLFARWVGGRAGIALGVAGVTAFGLLELDFAQGRERRSETLAVFLLVWENHGALYHWLAELFALPFFAGGGSWTVDGFAGLSFSVAKAGLWARCVLAMAFALVFGRILWRTDRSTSTADCLRSTFLVLATLFLVSPVGFPWYFIPCAALLPFARSRAWFLLPALLSLYYLWFWFEHQHGERGLALFDNVVMSGEYALFYALLGVDLVRGTLWRSTDSTAQAPHGA